MMKKSLILLIILGSAGVIFTMSIPAFVRSNIYPAPSIEVVSPAPAPYEEITLALNRNATAAAWYFRASAHPEEAILFLHGNGENIQTMWQWGSLEQLAKLERSLMVLDYPGYGRSRGEASEENVKESSLAAFDRLSQNHKRVIVGGWSLGAAAAIHVAANRDVAGLMAFSPWTSLTDVATIHFPSFLVKAILSERYDSLKVASGIRAPVLLIHGAEDNLIPADQGRALAKAFPDVRFVELAGTSHNDLFERQEVWIESRKFLASLVENATHRK